MGVKCEYCGTDNGVTMYHGKLCKNCEKLLQIELKNDTVSQFTHDLMNTEYEDKI
jgi:hypothetical protein